MAYLLILKQEPDFDTLVNTILDSIAMLNEDAKKLILCRAIHPLFKEENLRSVGNQVKKRKDFLKRRGAIPLKKAKQMEANPNAPEPVTDREDSG